VPKGRSSETAGRENFTTYYEWLRQPVQEEMWDGFISATINLRKLKRRERMLESLTESGPQSGDNSLPIART
jgi:hypothetical protein